MKYRIQCKECGALIAITRELSKEEESYPIDRILSLALFVDSKCDCGSTDFKMVKE